MCAGAQKTAARKSSVEELPLREARRRLRADIPDHIGDGSHRGDDDGFFDSIAISAIAKWHQSAARGAAGGAIIGAIAGNAGMGAGIGAA